VSIKNKIVRKFPDNKTKYLITLVEPAPLVEEEKSFTPY
jgi:hypothetical protein